MLHKKQNKSDHWPVIPLRGEASKIAYPVLLKFYQPIIAYLLKLTFQMVFPASSATNNEPSFNTNTPTGRPYTSFLLSSAIKPVRKSSGPPEGFPFSNGTKATLYPANSERFQEPCSPINAPS
jgi:hypothetical protein